MQTQSNLGGKRKMVHFYLNTLRFIADAQLNIRNDIYILSMKLYAQNVVIAKESVKTYESQTLMQKVKKIVDFTQ